MKNISAPIEDNFTIFMDLVDRKKNGSIKKSLMEMSLVIKERYTEYLENSSMVENVQEVNRNIIQINALKSCYKNSLIFKHKLLERSDSSHNPTPRCPYCQIDRSTTWDHFLPSSKYPDFYVFGPNLIHACSFCNEKKGNKFVIPIRKTIHPYFDNLSEISYLNCTVQSDIELTAYYSIKGYSAEENHDPYTREIVKQHFDIYGLARKFRAEASCKIAEFRREVHFWTQTTPVPLSEEILTKLINSKIDVLLDRGEGPNHWELALWFGMKDFPGLHRSLQE